MTRADRSPDIRGRRCRIVAGGSPPLRFKHNVIELRFHDPQAIAHRVTYSADYDYQLPRELIAQYPLRHRADARLMVVDRQRGDWQHGHVRDLPEMLRPGDALVFNRSRVIPARLIGYRQQTGGRWQGLFVREDAQGNWQILGRTRGHLREGEEIMLRDSQGRERGVLTILASLPDGMWAVRPRSWPEGEPAADLLEQVGHVPLPHYIREGQMVEADRQTYQTIYADQPGSIAAPTAGLHFTPQLLAELDERGIERLTVTLHVGIGTFRPIVAQRIEDHRMHREWGEVPATIADKLNQRRQAGGRIIAVGTTTTRLLESAAQDGFVRPWSGETQLYICPSYQFQAIDGLLTNFHLPRSTLLVLVRTFGGDELIRAAYQSAVQLGYRFYSYGDAMLIL